MVASIDSSTDCRYDTEISVRCQQELAKDNSIELWATKMRASKTKLDCR